MTEQGRNNGITGLVDFPNFGAKLEGRVSGFDRNLTLGAKPRAGRGTTDNWAATRPLTSGGGLVVQCRALQGGWQFPATWRGERGTITITYDESVTPAKTETVSVELESVKTSFNEKAPNTYPFTIALRIVSTPVLAGFGGDSGHAQPAPGAAPAATDQQQWVGTQWTDDPNTLLRAGVVTVDVWGGLANTTAAETARIATVVAATVLPWNLKVKTAAFARDSQDGGTVVIQAATTDSVEDVTNPQSYRVVDALHAASEASVAGVNGHGAAPVGDTYTLRTTRYSELDDGNTLIVDAYGLRSTLADITYPATFDRADVSHLEDESVVCMTTGTAAAPATPVAPQGQYVGYRAERVNDVLWKHEFFYGNTTPLQKILFADATTSVDPDNIESAYVAAVATATSAEPASPPAAAAGYKLRGKSAVRLAGTPEQWEWRYHFAKTTVAEDAENEATDVLVKPSSVGFPIEQTATVRRLTNSAAPPAAPASPLSGATNQGVETREVNDNVFAHTFRYEANSDFQKREFPEFRDGYTFSFNGDDTAVRAAVYDAGGAAPANPAGAPTNNVKLLSKTDHQLTPNLRMRVWAYGARNWRDDQVLAKTTTEVDPNGLESRASTAQLTGEAAPAAPAGMKLRSTATIPLTSGLTTDYTLTVRQYAIRDTADDLVLPKTWTKTDPQGLRSEASVGAFNAAPSAPAGFVSRGVTVTNVGGTNVLQVMDAGLRSTRDDVEMGGSKATVDVSKMADGQVVTTVQNSATYVPPTNLAGTGSTLVLVDYDRRQENSGAWVYDATYALQTREQEATNRGTLSTAFADRPQRDQVTAFASGSNNVNVAFGTNTATFNPTTSTPAQAAAAMYAALQYDARFERVEVVRPVPGKMQYVVTYQGQEWILEFRSQTYGDLMTPYRLTVAGVVQVFVQDVVQVTSNLWAYLLAAVPTRCTLMELVLWKQYVGDILSYVSSAGYANSTAFLGLSAYCVNFAGIVVPGARIADSYRYGSLTGPAFTGSHKVGHRFLYDSRGIVNGADICVGHWVYTTSSLSSVTPRSWVNASALGIGASGALLGDFNQTFLNTTP